MCCHLQAILYCYGDFVAVFRFIVLIPSQLSALLLAMRIDIGRTARENGTIELY